MAYNPNIDHLGIVREVRDKWAQMTPGPSKAWTIINEVCLRLQALGEDAGLLDKPAGTQYLGYSIDCIVYRSGIHYDALQDAEGAANPQWQYAGEVEPTRWRPPLGDVPQVPDEPDVPTDPPLVCPCQAELEALRGQIEAVAAALDVTNHMIATGRWPVSLSHKWLGTLTGTVGPLTQE